MSGAEDFIAAVRDAVLAVLGPSPTRVAVGLVRLVQQAEYPDREIAEVRGITETPMLITSESWCQPFRYSVSTGDVTDKSVVVLYNQGQPMIFCLIGA